MLYKKVCKDSINFLDLLRLEEKKLVLLLVPKQKSTHKFLRKCLIFFALPLGLEPRTL